MLFRSESRQVSIAPEGGSEDSSGFIEGRSRRSFHRLWISGAVSPMRGGGGGGGGGDGGVMIQGTSSPDPSRLRYRGLNIELGSRGVPTSSSAVGGRLDSSPEVSMSPATRLATCNDPMSCMRPGTLVSERRSSDGSGRTVGYGPWVNGDMVASVGRCGSWLDPPRDDRSLVQRRGSPTSR